jgi:hypothetical protein
MPLMAATAKANGSRNKLSNGHTNRNGSAHSVSSQESSNLTDDMESTHIGGEDRPDVKRKMSSPLMPAFMVSAPGKVIVYGEHAVVHGKVRAYRALLQLRAPEEANAIGTRPPSPQQYRYAPTSSSHSSPKTAAPSPSAFQTYLSITRGT